MAASSWKAFRPSHVAVLSKLHSRDRTEVMTFLVESDELHYVRRSKAGGVIASVRARHSPSATPSWCLEEGGGERAGDVVLGGSEDVGNYYEHVPLRAYPALGRYIDVNAGEKADIRSMNWLMRLMEEIYDSRELAEARLLKQKQDILMEGDQRELPPFPTYVYQYIRERHGVAGLVKKICVSLLYSVHAHRQESSDVEIFARLLEQYYGPEELEIVLQTRRAIQCITGQTLRRIWGERIPYSSAIAIANMISDDSRGSLRANLVCAIDERADQEQGDRYIELSQLTYLSLVCAATTSGSRKPHASASVAAFADSGPVSPGLRDTVPDEDFHQNVYASVAAFAESGPVRPGRRDTVTDEDFYQNKSVHSPWDAGTPKRDQRQTSWLTGEAYSPAQSLCLSESGLICLARWETEYLRLFMPFTNWGDPPPVPLILEKLREEALRVLRPIAHDIYTISVGADAHLLQAAIEAALRPLKIAIQASGGSHARVLLNMGRAVEDMGGGDALREAVMCYSEAVMISPTRADALFAEAYALQRLGNTAEADRSYSKVAELDPKNAKVWYNWGCLRSYDMLDQVNGIKCFHEAAKLQPNDAAAYIHLGNIHKDRGDTEAAYTWYQKALHVDASSLEARYNMAALMQAQGRGGEAIRWLREVTEVDPTFVPGFYNLGIEQLARGQREAARRSFSTVLHLNPDNTEAAALLEAIPADTDDATDSD